jgi:hypothetical protein
VRKQPAGTTRFCSAPRAGRSDSDRDHYLSTRVPTHVHRDLKALAIAAEMPLYELLIEALEEYLVLMRGA